MTARYSTKHQIQVGSILLWKRCRSIGDKKFAKFLAISCIKMQSFFKGSK